MKSHHKSIGIETLESRRLLAAQIVNGELIATGTNVRDDIELRRVGIDDVRVTIRSGEGGGVLASQQTFDLDDFNRITARGLGGNDYLHVVGNVSLPNLTLDGGDGRFDALLARGGRFVDGEIIHGGDGTLVAEFFDSPPIVIVRGTAGNDRIAITDRGGSEQFLEVNSIFAGVVTRTDGLQFGHLDAGAGNDTIIIGDGVFIAGEGAVVGGDGNDFFDIGRFALVHVVMGDGDDTLFARGGPDNNDLQQIALLEPGAGIDTIRMDGQTELRMFGEQGGVENVSEAQGTVFGNGADNRITVRSSNTAGVTLRGGGGDDTLIGGNGPDQLFGEEGDDTLFGNGGNDRLDGGEGIDRLDGGPGDDTLLNGENNNVPQFFIADFGPGFRNLTAYGTLGADTMNVVRTGFDDVRITVNGVARTFDMDDFDRIILYGGPGNDTISAGNGVAEVFFFGRSGNDRLNGNDLLNRLSGDAGDDTIFGNAGNDDAEGGPGNDTLDGGAGDDALFGHEGDDTLTGGPGDDDMDGGFGNDTFFARDGLGGELVRGGFDPEGKFIDRAQADPDDILEGIDEVLA